MRFRREKDSLGEKEVPARAYYGIHTARALENFAISGLKPHPRFIQVYAMVKKAAVLANMELGLLAKEIGQAIVKASDELMAGLLAPDKAAGQGCSLQDQILVDVFHAGAGTSLNMNVNEVIANRAIELLRGEKGQYSLVHPNDHVNMSQSTNDTYPTAMRVCGLLLTKELLPVLARLEEALADKGREFDAIIKSGRTHLQDAVPIRLGQEFAAYSATIGKARERIEAAAKSLEEVGLGGTAVGTGLNAPANYPEKVVKHLSQISGLKLKPAPDMREAMQSNLPIAALSGSLKLLALELTRIANDLRLLSSGPRTGLAEITLPPVQPGSSIMPGKVNPSMAEVLNMVAFQVIGNDLTIGLAAQAGQLELNVMMPVMAYNLFQSLEILTKGISLFTEKCIVGITADEARCSNYAEESVGLAAILSPYLGYDETAKIFKESQATGKKIAELIAERRLLPPEKLKEALNLAAMTEPGVPGKK